MGPSIGGFTDIPPVPFQSGILSGQHSPKRAGRIQPAGNRKRKVCGVIIIFTFFCLVTKETKSQDCKISAKNSFRYAATK